MKDIHNEETVMDRFVKRFDTGEATGKQEIKLTPYDILKFVEEEKEKSHNQVLERAIEFLETLKK